MRELRWYSSTSNVVMRKPLRTKKTSTPKKPPSAWEGAPPRLVPWNSITATTATARRPSSAGRYPRAKRAGRSPSVAVPPGVNPSGGDEGDDLGREPLERLTRGIVAQPQHELAASGV